MIIRFANHSDHLKWDTYIENHPIGLPYHRYAWKQTVEYAYGYKGYYLIAEDHSQIKGVLPLVLLKHFGFNKQMVALPYCDCGEVLADNEKIAKELVSAALLLIKRHNGKFLEIRSQNSCQKIFECFNHYEKQIQKVRMVLPLPDDSDKLWKGLKSKVRSQIRKTTKSDLQFRWGSLDDLDIYYSIFSTNMRDLGSPVHSKKWFYAILRYYKDHSRMGLIYYKGRPIAIGIMLLSKHIACVPWASSFRSMNRLQPNMLLYWNFLKFSADNGFAYFDFGRSTPDEGTYRFKRQWNPHTVPLYWYIMGNNIEDRGSCKGFFKNRKLMENIWTKLPLKVANRIGPLVRKHISL